MADIDRLTIEIEANADSAVKSVKNLANALKALNKALSGFDADSTRSFTEAVSELAEAVSMFTSNSQAVKDVAQAFKDLGKSASSIRKAKGAAEDIAQAFNKMREATNVSSEVADMSTALATVTSSTTEVARISNALIEVLYRVAEAFARAVESGRKMIEEMNIIDTTFREIVEPAQIATTAITVFSNEMLVAMSNIASQVANAINILLNAFYRMVMSIEGASGGGQRLIEEMNVFDTTFREVVDPVDEASESINNFANSTRLIGTSAQTVSNAADNMADHTKKAGESANEGATKTNRFADALRRASSAISSFLTNSGGISSALRTLGSIFTSVGKKITSAFSGLKSFGKEIKKLNIDTPKLVKELTRMSKMLKLMVTRMALRAVIKEVGNGFKSLALHSAEFNQNVSSLRNGAKQLGYSFAAMVSPLINLFAPAIRYAINLLIKFSNALQQVFAALTGATSWNKAKEFTDDWAEDIKDANKEAKKLKKTVLGFDELNQLQEKTTGADASKNIEDMFETVKVDKKWKDLADWLKQMWKLGDFYDLGKKIGEKLRDMLESIPWEQIRKTANKLGGALASLINGFVEVERLGYDIGKTIAQSVNTVFEFLNGFVHKLHWDSIGKFIADTFNGFFENIDWALIKDTVVTGMAGLAQTLQTFIDNFHWDNISDFIINGIDVISSGIKTFVDGIKWGDLGVKIGDQINKIMEGVDWHDVGDTLGAVIEAAIDWAYGLVKTFSVDDAVQALTDFLDGVCDRVDFVKAGETLGTALHKLIGVIEGFWQNEENRAKIKQAIFDFFEGIFNSMTADDWSFIATTVGALALLKSLQGLISGSNAGITIALSVSAALLGFEAGSRLGKWLTGDEVYDEYPLPVVIQWFGAEMPTSLEEVGEKFMEWRDAWHSMMEDSDTLIKTLTTGIDTIVKGPLGSLLDHMGWLGEKEPEKLNDIQGGILGTSGGDLREYIENANVAIEKTNELKGSMSGMPSDVWDKLNNNASNAATNLHKNAEETSAFYDTVIKGFIALTNDLGGTSTVKGMEWYQNIKDSFKLSELEKDLDEGKISANEFWDAINGLGASAQSKGASDLLDRYVKDLKNLEERYESGEISLRQYQTELNNVRQNYKIMSDDLQGSFKQTGDTVSNVGKTIKDSSTCYDDYYKKTKLVTENVPAEMAGAKYQISGVVQELSQGTKDLSRDTEEATSDMSTDWQNAQKNISDATSGLSKATSDSMSTIQKSVDDSMKGVNKSLDSVKDGMNEKDWTFEGVWKGLTKTFEEAKKGIEGIWNKISEKLNGEYEIGGGKFRINLPKFAGGGFPENGLFMANSSEMVGRFSNGRTAVANNEQIVEGISAGVYNAVAAALASSSNGNSGYIANTIVVDGEVIARTVTKAQERQQMRYSPSMG